MTTVTILLSVIISLNSQYTLVYPSTHKMDNDDYQIVGKDGRTCSIVIIVTV